MPLPIHVLVVEDDRPIQQYIQTALEDEGYVVTVADNSMTAFELAPAVFPDLIILDIMMPFVDGQKFLAMFRRAAARPVPVLATSANHTYAQKARQLGAIDFLPKPFSIDELLDYVRRYTGALSG